MILYYDWPPNAHQFRLPAAGGRAAAAAGVTRNGTLARSVAPFARRHIVGCAANFHSANEHAYDTFAKDVRKGERVCDLQQSAAVCCRWCVSSLAAWWLWVVFGRVLWLWHWQCDFSALECLVGSVGEFERWCPTDSGDDGILVIRTDLRVIGSLCEVHLLMGWNRALNLMEVFSMFVKVRIKHWKYHKHWKCHMIT